MSTAVSRGPSSSSSSPGGGGGGGSKMNDFMSSNNNVTKFAFILFIVILFVMLLGLGVSLITMIFSPNGSPHLIDGRKDATEMMVIHQDPSYKGSIPVLRSTDEREGIEFTWSVWLYIKPADTDTSRDLLHVFHKGNQDFDETSDTTKPFSNFQTGMNWPNNAPGLYIDWKRNQFVIVMNTYEDILETIYVPDIPLNKWVNVIIRCQQNILDVYINGSIVKRYELTDVPLSLIHI